MRKRIQRTDQRSKTDNRQEKSENNFRKDKFDKPGKDFSKFKKTRSEDSDNERPNRPARFTKSSGSDKFGSENKRYTPRFNKDKPDDNIRPKKWSDSKRERKFSPPDYQIDKYGDDRKKFSKKGPLESRVKKPIENDHDEIRLNRFIANSGICSRREADELIRKGQILVNGKVVTELGSRVKRTDNIVYDKKVLRPEKPVYVLLNKPKDFITTTDDPEKRKTVMMLVEKACDERIYPVGRLDRNTTGLLLFTNDGDMADKLSHPSNSIKKVYQVDIDKPILQADMEKIQEGVELEDGKAIVDDLVIITPDKKSLGLEIHSGKNRIVRRIFESLGYEVIKLDRVMYAGLTKKDLPRGKWRYLNEKEVIRLKHFVK